MTICSCLGRLTANPTCPTHSLANHFPWYIDSDDTTNIDCECGERIGGGITEWAVHVHTTLTGTT